MASVSLDQVTKSFGSTAVINGVSLEIADGEFAVFVGPSGCGKSTLLRMISGLEATSGGKIFIGDMDHTHSAPSARQVAMVFQSYALYPHMTVEQNLSFGMRMRGVAKATIARKVSRAVDILRLADYLKRKPGELSGGQCQRVAIGRALVQEPQVFLFDEPLSNLDAELRLAMRVEIQALHRELGTTMIYVTHDQVEAMTLADKIVVLRAGNVEQVGAPLHLYDQPGNTFVAGFIGSPAMNFLPAREMGVTAPPRAARLGIRPEHWVITTAAGLALRITGIEALGPTTYLYGVLTTGQSVCVEARGIAGVAVGDTLTVTPQTGREHWFDDAGRRV